MKKLSIDNILVSDSIDNHLLVYIASYNNTDILYWSTYFLKLGQFTQFFLKLGQWKIMRLWLNWNSIDRLCSKYSFKKFIFI